MSESYNEPLIVSRGRPYGLSCEIRVATPPSGEIRVTSFRFIIIIIIIIMSGVALGVGCLFSHFFAILLLYRILTVFRLVIFHEA